jgi:hypothetical protein
MPTPLETRIAELFAAQPQVMAVALGGSRGIREVPDFSSDIDLYVYTSILIPVCARQAIVEAAGGALKTSLNLTYWGPGDEWLDAASGIEIDIVYFDVSWMEQQLSRVVHQHQPSLGYSTCLWYTLVNSLPLHDPQAWFKNLQTASSIEYPEPLRSNIIAYNHPVLRSIIPSYTAQIDKAVKRKDLVSVNHRLAAMLASYFDVVFALNRELHPGEKRLLDLAKARLSRLPVNMVSDLKSVLQDAGTAEPQLLLDIQCLLDHLDDLLVAENFQLSGQSDHHSRK